MNDQKPYLERRYEAIEYYYNKNYGDDKLCVCGHPYHEHFDPCNNMEVDACPGGCMEFEEETKKEEEKQTVWSDLYSIDKISKMNCEGKINEVKKVKQSNATGDEISFDIENIIEYYVFPDLSVVSAGDWNEIEWKWAGSDYRIVSVPIDLEEGSDEFEEYLEKLLCSRVDTEIWKEIAKCY